MVGESLTWSAEPAIISALVLVLAAAVSDVVSGRIPNKITYTGFIIGIGFGLWPALNPSITSCLLGILLAFVPGFLLFAGNFGPLLPNKPGL